MRKFDLEDRMVNYACEIITLGEETSESFAAIHLRKQLIRSATSAALKYGEAQSGESPSDFIHKLKIAVKELRESMVCLKIFQRKELAPIDFVQACIQETNELIPF